MRQVVLIMGPPGAGKTTMAHELGLTVYDSDDQQWRDDRHFRAAVIAEVRDNPDAQAAVIRTGATARSRAQAEDLCRPTRIVTLRTPEHECIERVRRRARGSIPHQLEGIRTWFANREPDLGVPSERW